MKELDLPKLFNKYNELYKKKCKVEDLQKITKEIKELLPELKDIIFIKLKNGK